MPVGLFDLYDKDETLAAKWHKASADPSIRAWFSPTAAATVRRSPPPAGEDATPGRSVAVQHMAQEAKAWTWMGRVECS
jgi:hypothetical protein